jgi:hypothetical protein
MPAGTERSVSGSKKLFYVNLLKIEYVFLQMTYTILKQSKSLKW